MKKMITIAALAVISSSSAYAYDYGYGNNQNDSNNGYESTTGTSYQYDMSDPSDRLIIV